MTIDIVYLQKFYASTLGKVVQQEINNILADFWPPQSQFITIGMGYSVPFFNFSKELIHHTFTFMPAYQGVTVWPNIKSNQSVLVDEENLPLLDQSVDRILMIHSLENCYNPRIILKEVWRVLRSDGQLFIIVPNRRGLWAHFDNNPFGHGRPYTMTQLTKLLQETLFVPTHFQRGLYIPPSNGRLIKTFSSLCETIGSNCLQKFCGIVGIKATKQLYAGIPVSESKKINFPLIGGLEQPAGA